MRLNGSTVNVPVANGLRRSFLGTTPEWCLLRLHVREMSCALAAYSRCAPFAERSQAAVVLRQSRRVAEVRGAVGLGVRHALQD